MINIFNKEKAKEFTRNLNKEINKLSGYRLKLYEPDEDPDGNFHALCSDVLKIGSQNNKCREKFAGILLSKSFQDLLYHKVGDHLGYSKDEIKKKSIRKKISDAVIASTFQDLRRRRDVPGRIQPFPDSYSTDKRFAPKNRQRDWRYGDYKYLDIPQNFFWNIFPSENKKVFSPYYIKENKLIIHDASIELNYSNIDNISRGEKFRVQESSQKEIFSDSFLGGKTYKKIFCDLKHLSIRGSTVNNGSGNRSESFYTRRPLYFFNKSNNNITDFKLESNIGYYKEQDCVHHFEIKKSFIGKNYFNVSIDAKSLKEDGKLYLETISRKITDKDLVLDADWHKLDENYKKQVMSRIDNINFKNQIKKGKDLWLYSFKNNHKNRQKLHKFFLKNNLKSKFWGNDKYRSLGGADFLVSGDFIIDVGWYFRTLNFPLDAQSYFTHIYSSDKNLKSINHIVKFCIFTVIDQLANKHITTHKNNLLNVLSIMSSYTKPVNLNESFQFIKGQLAASKEGVINDAKEFKGGENNAVSFMTSLRLYGVKEYRPLRVGYNPLIFQTSKQLYDRVWTSIVNEKKISLKENKSILGENTSKTGRDIEERNSRKARESLVNVTLSKLINYLSKKPSKKLYEVHDWLEAEQLRFCESYYQNFEAHPASRDGTSKKYQRVIKEYEEMEKKNVHHEFIGIYKNFVGDKNLKHNEVTIHGDVYVSPENKLRELRKAEDIEIKKFKKIFKNEHKEKLKKLKASSSALDKKILKAIESEGINAEKEYINRRLFQETNNIQKKIGFPGKSNQFIRYTTSSYNENGKELKELYKELNKTDTKLLSEELFDRTLPIADKITSKIRRWLIEEKLNFIHATESGFKIHNLHSRKIEKKNFFFYPSFSEATLDKFFTLKKTFINVYDVLIIDSIKNILSLVVIDNSFAEDLDDEIRLILRQTQKNLEASAHDGLLTVTEKIRMQSIEGILILVQNFIKIQQRINFDKAFYRVSKSLYTITSFIEGYYAYSRDLDRLLHEEKKEPESFFNPANKYFQYFKNINHGVYEPIKPNILKDLEKDRSNYALLQNKENMFIFINKDMHALLSVYERVFEEMITTTKDEINKISLTEGTHISLLKYPLDVLIGTWEAINHLKSIKRYINLLEKYDFYEIDQSINLVKNKNNQYISKEDASFAIRKPNKSNSKINLNDLSGYLKKYKNPRYQNDRKYTQCNDILKNNSIKIDVDSDDYYVSREDFINYIKKDGSYRKLKNLSIPTLDIRSAGFKDFTEMS